MSGTYAELQITSNFSFLRGSSHPEELVLRAAELGLAALALTDRNTLTGVVRAHCAAKEVGIRFVVGARLDLEPGSEPNAGSVVPLSSAGFAQVASFPSSGLTRESPVNALSTNDRQDCAICDAGNPCAMPKKNGGVDSHHSLRHAPILPSSGKQIVNASSSMPPLDQRGASGVGRKIGKAGGKTGKNRDTKGRSLLDFPTDRAA
ncbi:MAG: PHP domain-containing protein, partial [Geminicoccaceae bacterium]